MNQFRSKAYRKSPAEIEAMPVELESIKKVAVVWYTITNCWAPNDRGQVGK